MFDQETTTHALEKKDELLKINSMNLLFDETKTIEKKINDASEEARKLTGGELREREMKIYHDMVSSVLKIEKDEINEKDPFFKVTGIPLRRVYVEKANIQYPIEKSSEWQTEEEDEEDRENRKKVIIAPTTILLRLENEEDEKDSEGNIREGGNKIIPYGDSAYAGFFDPIQVNKDREWSIKYGFMELNISNPDHRLMSGVFGIERDVVKILEESLEGKEISNKLNEMMIWFNHDLVAHGTFLTGRSTDSAHLGRSERQESQMLDDIFRVSAEDLGTGEVFKTAFAGELWSLNLHQSIFKEFIESRPSVMRYLRAHFDAYMRLVEASAKKLPDHFLAADYKDYLLKAYGFGFFRLIDPHVFESSTEFDELHKKYPNAYKMGNAENEVRKYVFGEEGLPINKGKNTEKRMPHKRLFEIFDQSLKDNEIFNEARGYFEKNTPIPGSLRENLFALYARLESDNLKRELEFMIERSIDLEQIVVNPITSENIKLISLLSKYHEIVFDLLIIQGVLKEDFVEEFLTQLAGAFEFNLKIVSKT